MLRLNAVHLAVCLLPLALAGCGEPADHDDPRIRPPLVRVATVERAGGRLAGLYRRDSGPNPKRPRFQGGGKSA